VIRFRALLLCLFVASLTAHADQAPSANTKPQFRRVVILKIDGLNADLLYSNMRQIDPATGKSRLPWLSHIFAENGTIFENFYTRGLSLSVPSWSMLDTGHHTVIRGNVEYDRFTGHVYDYLNFFPFYIGFARKREVDMPGAVVLDRAGIPLLLDAFSYDDTFQSFQLFQRSVRWNTLLDVLARRVSPRAFFATIENGSAPALDQLLAEQTKAELTSDLKRPEIVYLDFFTGDIDHEGHANNDPAALLHALRQLDALSGRLWTASQASPLADQTLFVAVSDHGMNNVPAIYSQAFSLPDFFNSPAGGAHHVVTDRHQLSDYKLLGLNPLVNRVVTPSTASFYLQNQGGSYPTAWLDVDGNERAAVHLRNSDLNKIHILLLQLASSNLSPTLRKAAAVYLSHTIEVRRAGWAKLADSLGEEMGELEKAIGARRSLLSTRPNKALTRVEELENRRLAQQCADWQSEYSEYNSFLTHLRALMSFQPDETHVLRRKIGELIPAYTLGESNTAWDLRHYVAGPAEGGLVLTSDGRLNEDRSFHYVDYFPLLTSQRVANSPQAALGKQPIDFTAMRLPSATIGDSPWPVTPYWLYAGEDKQIVLLTDTAGRILAKPVAIHLEQDGTVSWTQKEWQAGLPLHLFEDDKLAIPATSDRAAWLSSWHTEREWLNAIHKCEYSNGVIGVIEELSSVGDNVPGAPGADPIMLRYERRRRELVQPDFEVFAADHWNFNVRNFNPGGNHGSFLRISTHSVWMMAGKGIETRSIDEPYDSLNFASTVLALMGKTPPMPDHVVSLRH